MKTFHFVFYAALETSMPEIQMHKFRLPFLQLFCYPVKNFLFELAVFDLAVKMIVTGQN